MSQVSSLHNIADCDVDDRNLQDLAATLESAQHESVAGAESPSDIETRIFERMEHELLTLYGLTGKEHRELVS